jgi:aminoglycoside phosphotransferase (APT) family kinase protein
MGRVTMHEDELPVDDTLVRRLVDEAFPEYAGLPLRALGASGSTNALFRLGEDLLVRVPRQPGGGRARATERRWAPLVAAALPVPLPEVVAVGAPTVDHPEPWAVVRWLDGEVPATVAPDSPAAGRSALARDLAAVVNALRGLDVPAEAAADPDLRGYRGGALAAIDDSIRAALEASRTIPGLDLDLDAAAQVWAEAVALPGPDGPAVAEHWFHGDLLAENLLVRDGRLAAVLDPGGLGVGDPTVDLAVAWDVLDPAARAVFRAEVGVDETTWGRARGWALALAVMTFPYYWDSMPARCASRLLMARSVLADAL